MKNENDLTFSFFIFQVLRKINWHSGTRIIYTSQSWPLIVTPPETQMVGAPNTLS